MTDKEFFEEFGKMNKEERDELIFKALGGTKKKGKYTVEITGDYSNWTAGCSKDLGVDVANVLSFGRVGISYSADDEQYGTFWNCFSFNKISAKDIPDSKKLTDMSGMFGGVDSMMFNSPAVARWDTSNVTSMLDTFCNGGKYDYNHYGFNQDITRWDTSKVKSMDSMFFSAFWFNQPINCWNVENVENITKIGDCLSDEILYVKQADKNILDIGKNI